MRQKTATRPLVAVPASEEEASRFIAEIGEFQRQSATIENDTATQIETLKAQARERVWPLEDQIGERIEGLLLFAQAHRAALTRNGKRRTIRYPSGEFGWRLTKPAVVIRGVERVLEALKQQGFGRFVRVREEINKQALLAEPDVAQSISGVSISQREEFFVKPSKLDLEITRPLG